ncbi:TOBE domain-containing protein [Streptomyces sp. NPDC002467]|uniref:TOBE domain-containing protein n=1 Tax=Streptomyces sp. NPDC002467 TaxID=3364647 RepID=UPI00368D27B8
MEDPAGHRPADATSPTGRLDDHHTARLTAVLVRPTHPAPAQRDGQQPQVDAFNGGGLTAAITADAVKDLGLAAGTSVVALVEATEIALAAA